MVGTLIVKRCPEMDLEGWLGRGQILALGDKILGGLGCKDLGPCVESFGVKPLMGFKRRT